MNVSLTATGLGGVLVYLLVLIGKYFDIEIAETDAMSFVQNVLGAIGILLAYYGQYRRKDLVAGIWRK